MPTPDINRALGRIEGHLEGIREDIGELKLEQSAQGLRLGNLEGWKSRATGLGAAVAFVVSMIVTFVTSGFSIGR